eukprot:3935799-Rhodomonas_salina.1
MDGSSRTAAQTAPAADSPDVLEATVRFHQQDLDSRHAKIAKLEATLARMQAELVETAAELGQWQAIAVARQRADAGCASTWFVQLREDILHRLCSLVRTRTVLLLLQTSRGVRRAVATGTFPVRLRVRDPRSWLPTPVPRDVMQGICAMGTLRLHLDLSLAHEAAEAALRGAVLQAKRAPVFILSLRLR